MKIAVVGSGVSGLAATWALNEFSGHEVHLFEADDRAGGHANTIQFQNKRKVSSVDVDTGFIVLNPSTYPNFLRFLENQPNVQILPTEMTFSVSRDRGFFEWAGNNLATVFCQPSRILDASMWRLIYDVLRFNACARRLITDETDNELSIGNYLETNGYSDSFRDNYLIPMTAAIWSTPPDLCATDFPARPLVQFMHNHHLLQITGKPAWLTVAGGSKKYVDSITSKLPKERLHLSTLITSVSSHCHDDGHGVVMLQTASGHELVFDRVIMACHSDTTLAVLRTGGGTTLEEETILGRVKWNKNEAVLHSDIQFMPKSRLAWSCWNYLTSSVVDKSGRVKANVDQVSLTYSMNLLQHISEEKFGPVLVTLNSPTPGPREDKVVGRYQYDHPVISASTILSQEEMPKIQNKRGISYAGAWLGYGFHEDGFTSGLRAAVALDGVKLPFDILEPDRAPEDANVSYVFDFLEMSGLRRTLGFFGRFWLGVWVGILGMFIDLSHLNETATLKPKQE